VRKPLKTNDKKSFGFHPIICMHTCTRERLKKSKKSFPLESTSCSQVTDSKGNKVLVFVALSCYDSIVMKVNEIRQQMINELGEKFGDKVTRKNLMEVWEKYGVNPGFLTVNKIDRGLYDISQFTKNGGTTVTAAVAVSKPVVTDEELLTSQRRKFRTLNRMADGVVAGNVRSMIVSGPAGIGKTYTIEGLLESSESEEKIQYTAVRGFMKATGLYKLLWENREENQVILLDDCDSAFQDEVSLNLLKAALDSSKKRVLAWRSEKRFEDECGEEIPNSFEYRGSIVFITNLNFEQMINQGNKLAPHFSALISRSFYIDLNMGSSREYLLRIKDVLQNTDMAYTLGLSETQTSDLMNFIEENYTRLRELSLRMVGKLAKIMLFADSDEDFRDVAEVTCFKVR